MFLLLCILVSVLSTSASDITPQYVATDPVPTDLSPTPFMKHLQMTSLQKLPPGGIISFTPQVGYFKFEAGSLNFNGLLGLASGGLILESCQPSSVFPGAIWAKFSANKVSYAGENIGYFVQEQYYWFDSTCLSNPIYADGGFVLAKGGMNHFDVVPTPALAAKQHSVAITQYSGPAMTGQVIAWAFFPTGQTCQNTGPLTDMMYLSCSKSSQTYLVETFTSNDSSCSGEGSVNTYSAYDVASLQYSMLDLGMFAGYDSYQCF